jgi:hypothetical protein
MEAESNYDPACFTCDLPEKQIHIDHLIDIFTHGSRIIDGRETTVIKFSDNSIEHKLLIIDILSLTPYYYQILKERHWFRARVIPPVIVRNTGEMILQLKTIPDSIGHVNGNIIYRDRTELYRVEIIYD